MFYKKMYVSNLLKFDTFYFLFSISGFSILLFLLHPLVNEPKVSPPRSSINNLVFMFKFCFKTVKSKK